MKAALHVAAAAAAAVPACAFVPSGSSQLQLHSRLRPRTSARMVPSASFEPSKLSPLAPPEERGVHDVVVVGAGPSGLALAACLSEQNLNVAVVDPAIDKVRTVATIASSTPPPPPPPPSPR